MKRLLIAAAMMVGFALPALYAQIIDMPVARVELYKVDIITQKQLQADIAVAEKQTGGQISQAQRKQFLDAQIGVALIDQAAEHDKVTVTDNEVNAAVARAKAQAEQLYGQQLSDTQFQQIIANQGETWDYYTNQIRRQLIEEKYVRQQRPSYFQDITPPTSAEIEQTYEQYATQFTNPAMVRFSQLYIDTRQMNSAQKQKARQTMDKLAQEIRTGQETFDSLMKKSVDDPAFSGGDFGYLLRNDPRAISLLGNEFINKVFSMKDGEVSGVLTSNSGYHIIKITDKRAPKLLTLDDPILPGSSTTVKDQITQALMNQEQQKAFTSAANDLIASLKKKATIKIYEENLNW